MAHPQPRLAGLAAGVAGLLLATGLAGGCRRPPADGFDRAGVRIEAHVLPQPPTIGPATLTLTLSGATVDTLAGAQVDVVGHMTHPGMTPVVATMTRRGPDIFDAALDLSMAGDWQLVATVRFPDGRRVESRTPVRVQAQPAAPAPKP